MIFPLIYLSTLATLVGGGLLPPGYTCYWDLGRYQCTNKPFVPQPITKTITTTVRNKPTTVKTTIQPVVTQFESSSCTAWPTSSLRFRDGEPASKYVFCQNWGPCVITGYSTTLTTTAIDGAPTTIVQKDYPETVHYTTTYCGNLLFTTTVWPGA